MNRFITTQRDNVEIRKVGWELRRREEGRKEGHGRNSVFYKTIIYGG